MKTLVAVLALATAAVSSAALGCDIPAYDKRFVRINTTRIPADMVRTADRIDVAVAEAVEFVDVDAFLDRAWAGELAKADAAERERIAKVRRSIDEPRLRRPEFGQIRFRVVENLKGAPEENFTLMGFLMPGGRVPENARWDEADKRGDFRSPEAVYNYSRMVQGDVSSGADCSRGLVAYRQTRYLIFRDKAGNLLGEVRSPDSRWGGNRYQWPVYVPLSADDPWLARVRNVVAKAR